MGEKQSSVPPRAVPASQAAASVYCINTRYAVTFLIVFLLDRLTKAWALASLARPIPVIGAFFALELRRNTGAAFSILTGQNVVLAVVAGIFVILTLFWQRQVFFRQRLAAIALGMMAGGALGNLIDRLLYGAVTDFIAFSFWPAFNVADSCLVTGALLLVWCEWRGAKGRQGPR